MIPLDLLIEQYIDAMAERLSAAEAELLRIAGKRLKVIGVLTTEQLQKYTVSAKLSMDLRSDITRLERLINQVHRENLNGIASMFDYVTGEVYSEGLQAADGQPPLPFDEFKHSFNPLLANVMNDYSIMSRSSTVNADYRKTINKYVNAVFDDKGHENMPNAMRKAIRELAENGISTVDYASGRRMRMDSAVRMNMMSEMTNIVQEINGKLGEEMGADAVEISSHEHSAEDHEDIQGRVFLQSEYGKLQNGEPARDVIVEKYDPKLPPEEWLGDYYQTDRPIGQWNCRHIAFNFFLGISEPSRSREDLKELKEHNEKGVTHGGEHYTLYEAEQHQRHLERGMRVERERLNALKEVRELDPMLDIEYMRSKNRLEGMRSEYRQLGEVLQPEAVRMKWDRSYVPRGSTGVNAKLDEKIQGVNYTKKDLLKTALGQDKNNHTHIGLAFQSHNSNNPNRDDTFQGKRTSNPAYNNEMGLKHLQEILFSDKTEYNPKPNKVMNMQGGSKIIGVIEARLPDGTGCRWSIDGEHFIGLLSKYAKKP